MQIAFCIFKYFPHGGIQRDLLKICRGCRSRGMRVRIYTIQWLAELPPEAELRVVGAHQPETANPADRSLVPLDHTASTPGCQASGRTPNIEIAVMPVRAFSQHRLYERFAARVREDLNERPVDLVVGMNKMPGLDVYYAGDSCYQDKARRQRHFLYRLLPRYRSFLRSEKAVFDPHGSTAFLTLAERQATVFQQYYGTPPGRFHPLPPGIEPDRAAPPNRQAVRERVRRELGLTETEQLLLFVGSGFSTKGLIRVLRGLGALPRHLLGRTRLYVLGDDKAHPFARAARRLGVGDRVRFLGGRDDVPNFLLAGDGLVLPAFDEMAGMVILEAMIAGLPALVTENCGYAGYLRDAGAGLITPVPFRQQMFNAQLVELLTSQERDRWSSNGMALANDENIYRMVPTAVGLIERFAKAQPVRPPLISEPGRTRSRTIERFGKAHPMRPAHKTQRSPDGAPTGALGVEGRDVRDPKSRLSPDGAPTAGDAAAALPNQGQFQSGEHGRVQAAGDAAAAPPDQVAASAQHHPLADRDFSYVREGFAVRTGFAAPHSAEQLLSWAETVEGEVYRRARGRCTRRVIVDGRVYFLKFHSGVGWRELAKNWLIGKRPVLGAENEFLACQHLQRWAIDAPRVAAFAATRGNPMSRRSFIVCDELAGFESLETTISRWDAAPPPPRMLRRLVVGVAEFVRRLHAAGVVHRDLYLCHLWLHTDTWAAGAVRLAVLDLHRARILTPMPDYWRKRDLAALLFSFLDTPLHRNAWLRFVRVYSGEPLREAFAAEGAFWRSVYRRAIKLYEKGSRKGLVEGRFAP